MNNFNGYLLTETYLLRPKDLCNRYAGSTCFSRRRRRRRNPKKEDKTKKETADHEPRRGQVKRKQKKGWKRTISLQKGGTKA